MSTSRSFFLSWVLMFLFMSVLHSQDGNTELDKQLGLRLIRNGLDYIVYKDQGLNPNVNHIRRINHEVFFRVIDDVPPQNIGGVPYQLISIPGAAADLPENLIPTQNPAGVTVDPRDGRLINKYDYDHNFWIEVDLIEDFTRIEYFRYANEVSSGLLTAPFKYRLEVNDSPEALLDGDFNIAPFIGWKWRVSSTKPYYIAPFVYGGITTLAYNSANNSLIADSNQLENGTGLTYGFGVTARFGNVSPGFIWGWDKGFGNLASGYLYNNSLWLSFSVNYDFVQPEKTAAIGQ